MPAIPEFDSEYLLDSTLASCKHIYVSNPFWYIFFHKISFLINNYVNNFHFLIYNYVIEVDSFWRILIVFV